MSARAPHLQDDSLSDCYFAERRGEALDPPAAEHLADCPSCAERYAEFERFMASLRDEANAEVDALFPAERLRLQQQEIARRLDHIGRAARVISFPGRVPASRIQPSTTRMATRWIAGAAAAGLFVGVAAGTFFDFSTRFEFGVRGRRSAAQLGMRQGASPAIASHLAPVPSAVAATRGAEADDAFMSALDLALDRPHTSELVAFDALTPHVREIDLGR
jgi:anti-sigma factor RsiW